MDIILFLIWTAIIGLVIGALGRLLVPGPNAMGIGATILAGLGGAFLGGLVGALLGLAAGWVLLLQIAAAALIVYAISRRPARAYY